jgi:hypothetical protein
MGCRSQPTDPNTEMGLGSDMKKAAFFAPSSVNMLNMA